MKQKIILLLMVFCPIGIFGQTWDYPVKPGTEEWKKFQSNEEMVKACQVPESILQSLSTNELIDIYLRYPLLYDVFAFNNTDEGLDKLFSDFNGIRALYKRKDASDNLIKRYIQKIHSFSLLNENRSELEKGDFIVAVDMLELILSRFGSEKHHDVERKETAKNILRNLVKGYEEKFKYAAYFQGSGFRTNIYSRASIVMNNKNMAEFSHMSLYSKSEMTNEQFVKMIDELSYQLIK